MAFPVLSTDKTIQLLFKNANPRQNNNNDGESVVPDRLAQMRALRFVGGGVIQPLADQQVRSSMRRYKFNFYIKFDAFEGAEGAATIV